MAYWACLILAVTRAAGFDALEGQSGCLRTAFEGRWMAPEKSHEGVVGVVVRTWGMWLSDLGLQVHWIALGRNRNLVSSWRLGQLAEIVLAGAWMLWRYGQVPLEAHLHRRHVRERAAGVNVLHARLWGRWGHGQVYWERLLLAPSLAAPRPR